MLSSNEQPLVSVILPTYNGERYLEESVTSVLNQTFSDWELIIVDDCSTDGTLELARRFASQDSRIRVVHNEENKRLPATLNIGFHASKGKLLTWTSDDNRYLSEALNKMRQCLMTFPELAMVCADCVYIDESGDRVCLMPTYDEDNMLIMDSVGACFMYRREVLDSVGDYDTDLFCVEDYDYWQRILKHYGHIERLPEVLYEYRRHGGSLTVQKRKRVRYQNSRLYAKNMDDILLKFQNDYHLLCWLYYEMLLSGYLPQYAGEQFIELLPFLRDEEAYDENCSYLLFGAGEYGLLMRNRLGNRAISFIDNDLEKIGTNVGGLPVMSLQEAKECYLGKRIMLSLDHKSFYEIIAQLHAQGIEKYTTCISLLD